MRKIVIEAGDILTPLGNREQTWQALLAGQSGIKQTCWANYSQEMPLGLIPSLNQAHGSLARQQEMFEQLLATVPTLPRGTKLFCATTKAAIDMQAGQHGELSGQVWQIGEELAAQLGLEHMGTVSAACVSGLVATLQAAMHIASGKCDHALVIGFDLLTKFTVAGFASLKGLSPQVARPFDQKRDGLSLADGAGWLLLSAADSANYQLAQLGPYSISCDATHITAPSREASGLIAAINQLKAQATETIGGVLAHGTATLYNDSMELKAFSATLAPQTPVCSVKGALGHSLAASGLVETVLSLNCLKSGVLPPTVGLRNPEESSCQLSGDLPLALGSPSLLTCNSGFGGVNAALLLYAPEIKDEN